MLNNPKFTNNGFKTGECYKIECAEDNQSYKVHTHSGAAELVIECKNKGDKSSGYYYEVEFVCEDPAIICKKHTSCPDDCHHRYWVNFQRALLG